MNKASIIVKLLGKDKVNEKEELSVDEAIQRISDILNKEGSGQFVTKILNKVSEHIFSSERYEYDRKTGAINIIGGF